MNVLVSPGGNSLPSAVSSALELLHLSSDWYLFLCSSSSLRLPLSDLGLHSILVEFITLLPLQPLPPCLHAGSRIEFSSEFLLFQLLILDLRGEWGCLGLVQDVTLAFSGPLVVL